jgi:hypothetical protein
MCSGLLAYIASFKAADFAAEFDNMSSHLPCLVILIALATTVQLAPARVDAAETGSAQSKATPAQPSHSLSPGTADHSTSPFRITLSDGAVIELLAVSDTLSPARVWWRPDGSPVTNPPLGTFREQYRPRRQPGSLLREFVVDAILGPSAEVVETHFTAEGGHLLAHSVSQTRTGDKIHEELRLVRQLKANSRTTIVLDYAAQPWQTITEFLHPLNTALFSHKNNDGTRIVIGGPDEFRGSTRVMVTYDLSGLEHKIVRILAIDDTGTEHVPDNEVPFSLRNAKVLAASFKGLSRNHVRSLLFQTRSIQRIEFRNVSLHSGQRTVFQIHIEENSGPHVQGASVP